MARGRFEEEKKCSVETPSMPRLLRLVAGPEAMWTGVRGDNAPGKHFYSMTSMCSIHFTQTLPYWCRATSLMGYPCSSGSVSPFTS